MGGRSWVVRPGPIESKAPRSLSWTCLEGLRSCLVKDHVQKLLAPMLKCGHHQATVIELVNNKAVEAYGGRRGPRSQHCAPRSHGGAPRGFGRPPPTRPRTTRS